MRIFLSVLILITSLQSFTKADDISEFEIEGMSIGDSLLDFFTEKDINSSVKDYYPKSKKFYFISLTEGINLETYDFLQFHLLSNDKKYIIYSVEGMIMYKKNIEDCYKLKNILVGQIKSLFPNSKDLKYKKKHDADTSGKSTVDAHNFILESGAKAFVKCSDWSDTMPYGDKLTIGIDSKEVRDFINYEAYD